MRENRQEFPCLRPSTFLPAGSPSHPSSRSPWAKRSSPIYRRDREGSGRRSPAIPRRFRDFHRPSRSQGEKLADQLTWLRPAGRNSACPRIAATTASFHESAHDPNAAQRARDPVQDHRRFAFRRRARGRERPACRDFRHRRPDARPDRARVQGRRRGRVRAHRPRGSFQRRLSALKSGYAQNLQRAA